MTATGSGSEADEALAAFRRELGDCIKSLQLAEERAEQLQRERAKGLRWSEIVPVEPRPLIVEHISSTLGTLSTVGGRWRRQEALALHAEGVSINRIAALFNVTRQRASTLVKPDESS